MEILLIVPKYAYSNLTQKKGYNYMFPLGLAYISSVIKKENYSLDILNLNHFDGEVKNLVNSKLDEKNYDLVCTGDVGIGYVTIEKIIDTIKSHKTKPRVILGGAIITSESELISKSLNFDFAVIGEGETTIIELLKAIEKNKDLNKIDGICYKDKNKNPIFTKPRELIEDLDSLPYPDLDGLGFKEYLDNRHCNDSLTFGVFDFPRLYYVLGSRGCPFQCTFCYHSIGEKYRVRSVDNIIEEIKSAIKNYKINCFYLYDDLFSFNKERLSDFCDKIKKVVEETPWELRWACQLWVGGINKDLLQKLKDSGCTWACFGFESYSQKVLNSMRKPITPKQINETIELLKEVNMPIMGNFIFGDIAETKETAKETLDYWKKSCEGQIQLYFIQHYPGAYIFDYCVKNGIIKDKLDFIRNKMCHTVILNMTKEMNTHEFEELKKDVFKAKRDYMPQSVPTKIKKTGKDIYELTTKCPYCGQTATYKNCFLQNKNYFCTLMICRHCPKRFNITSFLYKFTMDYYLELDFFRKNFLLVRDKLLKKTI